LRQYYWTINLFADQSFSEPLSLRKLSNNSDVLVVGAGIAGVMTALSVLRRGHAVTLIDRWEPGHPRASSTDYTRVMRSVHGRDRLYTQWVREARLRWMELQQQVNQTLLVECGALVIATQGHSQWEDSTFSTFDDLGVPYFKFDPSELATRFPQFDFKNVKYGIYEPESGLLMAHRAVVESARLFEREGGRIVRGRVYTDDGERLYLDGEPLAADLIIAAAGPWLGNLYRRTVGPILKVVRQNIIYTSCPDANRMFEHHHMPCWIDHGHEAYGTPSIDGYGIKAAIAWTEAIIDLDNDERVVDEATFNRTRLYIQNRLPALVGQKAVDQKACQIAMTPDTHFIVDFHPRFDNVLIVGGCSGHLFKHGPVLGDFAAGVGLREFGTARRFKLGSRSKLQDSQSPSGR